MKSAVWGVIFWIMLAMQSCGASSVTILCYHDVDNPQIVTNNVVTKNIWNISSGNLRGHFLYLRNNGYRVLTVDEYLTGNYNGDKNVLISFDDGYRSFYTKVYPLLREFNYQAVLAIHNEWFRYRPADVGELVTLEQMREMASSSLVELASHTYASHKNKPSNPQGGLSSVIENRLYFNGRYETESEYRSRLNSDFAAAQEFFVRNFGHKARIMVWPYGRYSGEAMQIAMANGFELSFLLDGGTNKPLTKSDLLYSKRYIIYNDLSADGLAKALRSAEDYWRQLPIKMAQVDLDDLYDREQTVLDDNISRLIADLQASRYNTVALQAFCDLQGDGIVKSVYFHTDHAPIKVDVFGYIANRLSQEGFRVLAWMPTLSAAWLSADSAERIVALPEGNLGWYRRATPFSPKVRAELVALYKDVSMYTNIDGVLFQDDLFMNDFEDFSPYARRAFLRAYGYELTAANFHLPKTQSDLLKLKKTALHDLTAELKAAVLNNRPQAVFMGNIYAEAVLRPEAERWFAQSLSQTLADYDYTVIMAYPYMEKQGANARTWLRNLADSAGVNDPQVNKKVIFKLQKYDWQAKQAIGERELSAQIKVLQDCGVKNIAVYPESTRY